MKIIKNIKAGVGIALSAVMALSLSGCVAVNNTENRPEDHPVQGYSIWELAGEEAEAFADGFDADEMYSLTYAFYGEGGAEEYFSYDPEVIEDTFIALDSITVVAQTDEVADDFDDVFTFTDRYGNVISFYFNMHNLEADNDHYTIRGDEALWEIAYALREAQGSPQEISYNTVTSSDKGFSFEYNDRYQLEDGSGDSVIVYLNYPEDHPFIQVGRVFGTDAYGYLEEQAYELESEYGSSAYGTDREPVKLNVAGRDIYMTHASLDTGEGYYTVMNYAEDIGEGDVMYYTGICSESDEDAVEDAIVDALNSTLTWDVEDDTYSNIDHYSEGGWDWSVEILGDGSERYCFNDKVCCTIPADWAGKYTVIPGEYYEGEGVNYISFYHTASLEAWRNDLGYDGGWLFSLGLGDNRNFENYPHAEYIGEGSGGYYFLNLPTDVQGYMDDPDIWAEWQDISRNINEVWDSFYMVD